MKRWNATWPWLAVLVYAVAVTAWIGSDRRVSREAYPPFSARSTAPEGLSLAHRYLQARARDKTPAKSVSMLTRPVGMAAIESDAVVFRIAPDSFIPRTREQVQAGDEEDPKDEKAAPEPEKPLPGRKPERSPARKPGRKDRGKPSSPDAETAKDPAGGGILTAAEQEWIQGGGRLVLAIKSATGPLGIAMISGESVEKVYPAWPGVTRLELPVRRVLAGWPLRRTHTLFADGNAPVLARQRLGVGELVLLSCPEVFQNEHVGKADHLSLLEALAGEGRPVYFDEVAHGIQGGTGVLALVTSWGLGPMLVLALLAAGAAFLRRRVRLGEPVDDHRETRRESVDFVESVAQLYQRALPRRRALALYARHFSHAVSLKTGLRGDALQARVDALAPELRGLGGGAGRDIGLSEFRRHLERINRAFRRLDDAKRA
jgi:hypothetical protein